MEPRRVTRSDAVQSLLEREQIYQWDFNQSSGPQANIVFNDVLEGSEFESFFCAFSSDSRFLVMDSILSNTEEQLEVQNVTVR